SAKVLMTKTSGRTLPGARGSLAGMQEVVRPQGAESSAVGGKLALDRAWERGMRHEKGEKNPVPAETSAFSGAPKHKGLHPAPPRRGKMRRILSIPIAAAAAAAIPKGIELALQHPMVQQLWQMVSLFVTSLPPWMQTSAWIGTAFGAAWLLPKIVRGAGKWLFNYVDWDPLRESYLTNLAGAAAWFAAVGFAVFQMGGLAALGVNAGLFAATLTLATQDLAKNLAAGFQLYRNREHEFDFGDEITIWGETGRVESINVRFITLDTSENKDAEYDHVMMANEKVRSLGISNKSHSKGRLLAAASFLPAIFYGPFGPYLTVALLVLAGSMAKEWAAGIYRKADEAGDDKDLAKKYRIRGKIVGWVGNAAYLGGLAFILNLFGVPLVGITSALAVVSAAAGFWTKEVASDLVAGLMIAVWRPFGQGDTIQVGKHPRGVVETITPRTIRIRLDDGSAHYVPLEDLMKEKIHIGLKAKTEAAAE
ncbi:MAG: mechanosensitive ion channel domain-containing protein, partial [Elusimicrobiota bacterium]